MKKSFILTLSILLFIGFGLIAGCSSPVKDNTNPGGGDSIDPDANIIDYDIDTPTTLLSGNVYVVDGGITVTSVLTIQAGTIIKFTAESSISVNSGASINAGAGTALLPIIFTSIRDDAHGGDTNMNGSSNSPLAGDWFQISISGSGSAFNYCEFYYGGGYWDNTLDIDNVTTITNCTFAFNEGASYGVLDASDAPAGTVITGNRFYGNELPLKINTNLSIDDTNFFQDTTGLIKNTKNGIFIVGQNASITSAISWIETDVPYVIEASVTINAGASLTLAPGIIIKFFADAYMTINGTINANAGSSTTPIIFTSIKDDARGGDTNGDGTATSPQAADWQQITVTGSSSAFNYCEFYYSGGYWDNTLDIDNATTITNCTFAFNKGATYGVLDASDTPAGTVITGNRFYSNELPLKINTRLSLGDTNIFQDVTGLIRNTKNGIFVTGSNITGAINWSETEVAYVIESNLSIDDTGSLTLGNNVVVKFLLDTELSFNGNLTCGTGVAFTSIKDDSKTGDTNGDGTATSPADYDWYGIYDRNIPDYVTWANIYYDSY